MGVEPFETETEHIKEKKVDDFEVPITLKKTHISKRDQKDIKGAYTQLLYNKNQIINRRKWQ